MSSSSDNTPSSNNSSDTSDVSSDDKKTLIISASVSCILGVLTLLGAFAAKSIWIGFWGILLIAIGIFLAVSASKVKKPSPDDGGGGDDGGGSDDGGSDDGGDTPSIPEFNYPCNVRGVSVNGWFMSQPSDTVCYLNTVLPFNVACADEIIRKGTYSKDFSTTNFKTQNDIMQWSKNCNISINVTNPDGSIPTPAPPAPQPSGQYPCPTGYTGRNANGCITSYTSTCGQDCAKQNCVNAGGNFLNLDYSSNPYTCAPACPPPFSGYITNGTCSNQIAQPYSNNYNTGCSNSGGIYSYSNLAGGLGTATCKW